MLDIITDISSEVEQWNQTNWKQREKILLPMRLIINSQCHRMGFLSYLGEDTLPPGVNVQLSRQKTVVIDLVVIPLATRHCLSDQSLQKQ